MIDKVIDQTVDTLTSFLYGLQIKAHGTCIDTAYLTHVNVYGVEW